MPPHSEVAEILDESVGSGAAYAGGTIEPKSPTPDELVSWDDAQNRLDQEREIELPIREPD